MHFQVLVDETPQPVEFVFARNTDLAAITRWRSPRVIEDMAAVRDTLEFARRATEHFRYYKQTLPVANSQAQLRRSMRLDKSAEISMFFVARAQWYEPSRILAFAQCRRTYCNNLVLEFLGTHPRLVGNFGPRVSGVGTGSLCALAEFAHSTGIRAIWGEATAISAGFYKAVLKVPVRDHFYIEGRLLDQCRKKFRYEMSGTM